MAQMLSVAVLLSLVILVIIPEFLCSLLAVLYCYSLSQASQKETKNEIKLNKKTQT